jgi:hypothetical protein
VHQKIPLVGLPDGWGLEGERPSPTCAEPTSQGDCCKNGDEWIAIRKRNCANYGSDVVGTQIVVLPPVKISGEVPLKIGSGVADIPLSLVGRGKSWDIVARCVLWTPRQRSTGLFEALREQLGCESWKVVTSHPVKIHEGNLATLFDGGIAAQKAQVPVRVGPASDLELDASSAASGFIHSLVEHRTEIDRCVGVKRFILINEKKYPKPRLMPAEHLRDAKERHPERKERRGCRCPLVAVQKACPIAES